MVAPDLLFTALAALSTVWIPGLVRPQWIKPGACVIDVGVNRVGEKISESAGQKVAILRGDVDFDEAAKIAGFITPVPGGAGPMTIVILMKYTLNSLKFRLEIKTLNR